MSQVTAAIREMIDEHTRRSNTCTAYRRIPQDGARKPAGVSVDYWAALLQLTTGEVQALKAYHDMRARKMRTALQDAESYEQRVSDARGELASALDEPKPGEAR